MTPSTLQAPSASRVRTKNTEAPSFENVGIVSRPLFVSWVAVPSDCSQMLPAFA